MSEGLNKTTILKSITLLSKDFEIIEAMRMYEANKDIISYDEYLEAYREGENIYYQSEVQDER